MFKATGQKPCTVGESSSSTDCRDERSASTAGADCCWHRGHRRSAARDAVPRAGGASCRRRGRFRGIRLADLGCQRRGSNHRTNPPKGLFLRQDFRAGFAHLAPRQLTFEPGVITTRSRSHRSCPGVSRHHDHPRHFGGPLALDPMPQGDESMRSGAPIWPSWRPAQRCSQAGRDQYGGERLWLAYKATPATSQELVDATRTIMSTLEALRVEPVCSNRISP